MRGRVAEVLAISALATILTVVIAAPVLRAPSQRIFGMEIVGRHHDPFTMMQQFARSPGGGVHVQPVTDVPGALLARVAGAVAAYNWLVLLSFPLSAAAAYLLARHLALAPAGAAVAALAYAFSPFHLAHAAYHPHVAQTQWVPLYLLALWRCLDRASPAAVGFLGAAAFAVTFSNFYGGLIAAVLTPVAVAAYWIVGCRDDPRSWRRLAITVGSLMIIAACGLAYASDAARTAPTSGSAAAFARSDLFPHSAKWWSYLVPPVGHPLVGAVASRFWEARGVREGRLENQVSLGWGIVGLGLTAVVLRALRGRHPASSARVPVLVLVGSAALLCSLSPERTIGTFTFVRPSALLHEIVPMFRSYARFGIVVQLMAALLAGIAVDRLLRAGTTGARVACAALLALAAAEYAVAPSLLWRDVLPTTAHRWVGQQANPVRVLDCTPLNQESASIQWLTDGRVTMLGGPIGDCTEANLPQKLAANGFTHLLVRRDAVGGQPFADSPTPQGLRVAAWFTDAKLWEVTARVPAIYTAAMTGFSPREQGAEWSWRWMGAAGAWTVVNTGTQPVVATLGLEISAFHWTRRLEVLLNGRPLHTLVVDPPRRVYRLGPVTIAPGVHQLLFRPWEAPTTASDVIGNGDPRRLSFALGRWHWTVPGEHP